MGDPIDALLRKYNVTPGGVPVPSPGGVTPQPPTPVQQRVVTPTPVQRGPTTSAPVSTPTPGQQPGTNLGDVVGGGGGGMPVQKMIGGRLVWVNPRTNQPLSPAMQRQLNTGVSGSGGGPQVVVMPQNTPVAPD